MGEQSNETNVNPALTDDLIEDLEKIKGDAIGNTLYSERWVLKTLMQISQFSGNEWNDEFESNLCSLWDMTLEKDVVNLLMKHDIITIISRVIELCSTSNNRLTVSRPFIEKALGLKFGGRELSEYQVFHKDMSELSQREETITNILLLFDSPDAPVLIQLIRLVHATAWDLLKEKDNVPSWLENELISFRLCNYITFILKSSTNDELLYGTLEFLNTLCSVTINDKDFSQYFATSDLVKGMLESWGQLFSNWSSEDGFLNKHQKKIAEHWSAVLSSFTGHVNGRAALCENYENIGEIIYKIVQQPFESADIILISAVNILDSLVRVYFSRSSLKRLLIILNSLYQNAGETSADDSPLNSENLDVILQDCIENYCANVNTVVEHSLLNEALSECCENHVLLFWKAVNDRQTDDPGERVI
uniref:Protein rhodnius neglectus n=1 Tax=Rhodnius prolixus TaxID=13249 RepID=T1HRN2_RHOPR